MTTSQFNAVFEDTFTRSRETLCKKAEEYASNYDRLHNFKAAATTQGLTEPATALGGIMAKHTISVYDMIRGYENDCDYPVEMWNEKIIDHINYLILLRAVIIESKERDEQMMEELE